MKGSILGATLGDCIHVAGIQSFLRLAEAEGYEVCFLGVRISPRALAEAATQRKPAMVAVSYRLSPETATRLLEELKTLLPECVRRSTRFVFGGPPPVADVARRSGLFEHTFSGAESTDAVRAFLRGTTGKPRECIPPQNLVSRIAACYPYPLIRHHFGRPTLEDTLAGVRRIAEAEVLDVLSLGPDQNAQEHFFHPERMNPDQHGAGGVPLRKPEDLEAVYEASRCGNYPLVRCYSGTRDLVRWAEMSLRTIRIAWGAIPLCWYSRLDGRSKRPLADALRENLTAVRWYAERGVPVEINEAHQWSLRHAPDTVAVAAAYLAAYNAKRCGVRHYVSQYMFNTPAGTTPMMDLGKMLAKREFIHSLQDEHFTVYDQVRAGLASLSPRANVAKGQMAASAVVSMALKPHLLHVVAHSEGDHAATAEDVIEACEIARGVLQNILEGLPDCTGDPVVQQRKVELMGEARVLLEAIRTLAPPGVDAWADPEVLAQAVARGLLDAPGLQGAPGARGEVRTAILNGACRAMDPQTGKPLSEAERLRRVGCPV